MATIKIGKSTAGNLMHYSVGAIIKRDGKFLLLDRLRAPLGFAGVAGHVEDGETIEDSLRHQVEEESGMQVQKCHLLFQEEMDQNWCFYGVGFHYWYLYECETEGEPKLDISEAKSIGWYTVEEMKKMKLDPAWQYWFKKIEVL